MPSTTSFQVGEFVLVDFPFTSGASGKARPALVVLDSGDADIVLARVTSQTQQGIFDVTITDWQPAGLLAPSIVRVHKLATIAKTRVLRRLGAISIADRLAISSTLKQLLPSW